MIGQTLSHYRITGNLGRGGMGEVYLAEDSHLHRPVAIKLLSPEFSNDPERLTRFQREAEVLASLNHPNLATVYGLGQSDGTRFIVMEHVPGETLADRLRKGPFPVSEALEVCRQIADGLEAAHEKGVIHRDLKPANVMITPEDRVKILDFGLAKSLTAQSAEALANQSPTITEALTRIGTILGTAAYMSPEQAKGKAVDKRADVWAFGCVLYECLTAKAPFQGETVTETVAKILEGTPDWDTLPRETPPGIKQLLRRCLQRNPGQRLHDIADARIEIAECPPEPLQTLPVPKRYRVRWIGLSAATLLIGLMGGLLVMRPSRTGSGVSRRIVRASLELEPGTSLDGWRRSGVPTRTAMVLSSNGQFVVYSSLKENATPQDKARLYLRRLDQLEAKPITGTDDASSPFLSPDDGWVGFVAGGKLRKVPIDGGVATDLCDIRMPYGFSWGADNRIVFAPLWEGGLWTVSADGGKLEALTTPDKSKEEYSHRLPSCLPGGKGILFTIVQYALDLQPRTALFDPRTRRWRVLLEDAADARYIPTGHLAFMRQGTLMLAPFDPDALQITGQPFPIIDKVVQALNTGDSNLETGAGQFSISASGSLVFAAGGTFPDRENSLVWIGRKGDAQAAVPFKGPFGAPRLSPDSTRIAYVTSGKTRQVWVYDLNRATATRLTSEGIAFRVSWTPDSTRLVYGWSKGTMFNLYVQAADGSSPMQRLSSSEYTQVPGPWSPDGETLAFVQWGSALDTSLSGLDIMLLRMRDRNITPFLNSPSAEVQPDFSPDGRWLTYVSSGPGRGEVYVQPFPGPGGKWQISNDGGYEPLWSRNGKQLYYRRLNQVWVVDINAGSSFSATRPRLLLEQAGLAVGFGPMRDWDISADGQRFLMVKRDETMAQPLTKMVLVDGWFEDIRRLTSAK